MATTSPVPDNTSTVERETADLLLLVTAMPPEQFTAVLKNLETAFAPESVIVATSNELSSVDATNLRIISTPQSSAVWTLKPVDFLSAAQYGSEHEARAILILGPGADSLSPLALRSLADAVLKTSTDLVVPYYTLPPHTGLINSAILYPLTRAVFASEVRFPLSIDLGMSLRMAERLASAAQRIPATNQTDALLWPVNEAVAAGCSVEEVDVGSRATPQPSDLDLNAILALVTGSLFADIEAKAALWQRPRRPPPVHRAVSEIAASDGTGDVARMVSAFRLANANLQEIWSLVLPPNSLLLLKRCSVLEAAAFRMPDNLWARIVYDFLIAYRLRTINRSHLLGALIPLYLAWVAGHINVTASGIPAERHIEAVAAAFEADKPYLVARWRWPDRFNS
jgi:glucosylglycerate synthase